MKIVQFCSIAGAVVGAGVIIGCANSDEFVNGLATAGNIAVNVLEARNPPPPPPPPPPRQTVVVQQPVVVQQVAVAQPVVQQPVVQQPVVQQPVTVAQPVVQQPVAQQSTAPAVTVTAPASQPVVQQQAAPAVTATTATAKPTVAVAEKPAAEVLSVATKPAVAAVEKPAAEVQVVAAKPQLPKTLPRTTAKDTEVPTVRYGQIYVEKPATPEQIEEAKKQFLADKRQLDQARLNVESADEATVTCLVAAFPQAVYLEVKKTPLSSLAAIGCCTALKELEIVDSKLPDLAPLAALTKLQKLSLQYCTIPSLAPIGALPNVAKINLYGATLTDFSPLAGMPKLREINYYATKVPPEGYASLGKLKQVTKFDGGLTKMTSLAWLKEVPQTKELYLFGEKFDSYAPISALVNLEKITFWSLYAKRNSNPVGDLSFLAPCTKIKTLRLDDCDFTNLGAIAGMKDLQELNVGKAKQPVDVAVVKALPNLTNLNLSKCEVKNFEAIVGHPKLERLDLTQVKGVTSIKGLAGNKSLWRLMLTEGAFPQDEVLAVSNALKTVNRSFSLYIEKKR